MPAAQHEYDEYGQYKTTYTPTPKFIAWLQKIRPRAAKYFSEKNSYPMLVQLTSGRHRLTAPGTHREIDDAIDFDQQIDTAELCLVLDQHPDLY